MRRAHEQERADQRRGRAGDVGDGTHDAHDPSGIAANAVRSVDVVRTPAESHDFLVMQLPRQRAESLAAKAFDEALHDAEASNRGVAESLGCDEKIVRDMRLGAKPLSVARLLQVDDRTFYATVARLEAQRARVYGGPQRVDTHSAVATAAKRAGEFVAVCMSAVPRLVSSRTVSRDTRGAIGSAAEALSAAMRALQVALDAEGDR